ncbi:hypothetical protein QUF64_03790 [Anaerolineales bacterium HSG6]|nr:hypothetical protein [Anaerolineales bacterium HSG6]MDM8531636.1 hypothetical protein [Anaerolineales bacterium HSG25]
MSKKQLFGILLVFSTIFSLACGLAQPIIDRAQSNERVSEALASFSDATETPTRLPPTPRPTFTITPTPTDTATSTPTPTDTPTATPTPTETYTPEPTATPTETFTPEPTKEPTATETPVPPTRAPQQAPTHTPTLGPPTATPTPNWAFKMREHSDRTWQKTNYPAIINIALISDGNGTPLGGYYVVGEHSSGKTYKSPVSSWQYDVTNGLDGYIKQGNVKFELGPFDDGVWHVYIVDGGGTQISDKLPLPYSSNPETWVWDFVWWAQ